MTGRISCGAVQLRAVGEADHERILAWQNQPDVFDAMDYDMPFAAQDIVDAETRAREEGHPFIIEVGGTPIGKIGLNQVSVRDHRAALYVYIGDPAEWGKGYGTDAIVALLRYAFDRIDLHLVELWGIDGNERAFACYAHCGFVRDATLRDRTFRDGAHRARVVMSVTREEFASASQAWIERRERELAQT